MADLQYYILDTETTGLKAGHHDLTEISCIHYNDDPELTLQYSVLVKALNPKNANADALRITRKTFADLFHGEDLIDAIDKLDEFLNLDGLDPAHRVIVGHNIPFDRRFLWKAYELYDKRLPADMWLDTLPLMRKHFKRIGETTKNLKLIECCDRKKIQKFGSLDQIHGAKADTQNNYALFRHMKIVEKEVLPLHIKRLPHLAEGEKEEMESETED